MSDHPIKLAAGMAPEYETVHFEIEHIESGSVVLRAVHSSERGRADTIARFKIVEGKVAFELCQIKAPLLAHAFGIKGDQMIPVTIGRDTWDLRSKSLMSSDGVHITHSDALGLIDILRDHDRDIDRMLAANAIEALIEGRKADVAQSIKVDSDRSATVEPHTETESINDLPLGPEIIELVSAARAYLYEPGWASGESIYGDRLDEALDKFDDIVPRYASEQTVDFKVRDDDAEPVPVKHFTTTFNIDDPNPAFSITTPDPRFDPESPIELNGYHYVRSKTAKMINVEELEGLADAWETASTMPILSPDANKATAACAQQLRNLIEGEE